MKEVSVILVSYNTAKLTVACLHSIYEHTLGVDFEVILVDNASTDDSVAQVKTLFPQVSVVESTENLGFGRANNLGAQQAQGKYLFMLNTDTLLLNNSIKVLLDYYQSHNEDNLGAIGGVLLNADGSNGWSCNRFNTLNSILSWYYGRIFNRRRTNANLVANVDLCPGQAMDVDYVTGADLFLPRELFERTTGFDPNIFLYYEDELLQWHIKHLGLTNKIIGGTSIVHYEGASLAKQGGRVPNHKRIISERSMFYYFKATKGKVYKSWAKLIYFLLVALPLRTMYSFSENKTYIHSYIQF